MNARELNNQFKKSTISSSMLDMNFGKAVTHINPDDVSLSSCLELTRMIHREGLIFPVMYDDIKDAGYSNIQMVMQSLGLYTFPTMELIEYLKNEIDDNDPEYAPDAIEICAGTGWIGRSLDIPITDSRIQEREDIRQMYQDNHTAPIDYPDDVEKKDAVSAIKEYNPEFVIGSYVTRLWGLGSKKFGSAFGVDTGWVVNNCHRFYMIGNLNVHGGDPIMKRNHREERFPWLVTRGDLSRARIFVWENMMWR